MEAAHDGPSDAPASRATSPRAILWANCDWQDCRALFRKREEKHRFCQDACRQAWFRLHRPRVDSPIAGSPRSRSIRVLVLGVLMDGEWHDIQDLATKVHALPCSVSARLRELRKRKHKIERDLKVGNTKRPARYRLVP